MVSIETIPKVTALRRDPLKPPGITDLNVCFCVPCVS